MRGVISIPTDEFHVSELPVVLGIKTITSDSTAAVVESGLSGGRTRALRECSWVQTSADPLQALMSVVKTCFVSHVTSGIVNCEIFNNRV